MTVTLQVQAKALGDPTRHGIFRYVADAEGPVDVAELTAHFGLNHNAIRQHLAQLPDAALPPESLAPPAGRGRPRLVYRVDANAGSHWDVPGPYERLSVLLVEALRTGDAPVEVGRRSVRPHRASAIDADPVASVSEAMAARGFDPVVRHRGDHIDVVLRHCPYETAALADPDTVCAVHLGIAQGLAAQTGDRVEIDELVPTDPRRPKCRLRMHLVDAND